MRTFVAAVLLAAAPVLAAPPVLEDVSVLPGPRPVVTVRLSAPAAFRARALQGDGIAPRRLYLDLAGTVLGATAPRARDGAGALIRVRTGQFDPETTRVVLDLSGEMPFEVSTEGNTVKVTLSPPTPLAESKPPTPEPPLVAETGTKPATSEPAPIAKVEPKAAAPEPAPVAKAEPKMAAPEPAPVAKIEPKVVAPEPAPVAKIEPEVIAPEPAPVAKIEPKVVAPEPAPVAKIEPKVVAPEPAPVAKIEPKVVAPEPAPVARVEPKAAAPEPAPVALTEPKATAPESAPVATVEPRVAAPEPAPIATVEPKVVAPEPAPVATVEPNATAHEPAPIATAESKPLPARLAPTRKAENKSATPEPPMAGRPLVGPPVPAAPLRPLTPQDVIVMNGQSSPVLDATTTTVQAAPKSAAPAPRAPTLPEDAGPTPPATAGVSNEPANSVPKRSTRATPAPTPKPLIVVDAGHGGRDPGAEGVGGVIEKDVVLELSRLLSKRMTERLPVNILLTRTDDSYVTIDRRLAVPSDAILFISLHANSCPDPSARGLEIFYGGGGVRPADTTGASPRAALLGRYLDEALSARVGGVRGSARPGSFSILTRNPLPSALIEIGYLTHPEEAELSQDTVYLDLMADALVDGLEAFMRAAAPPL